MFLRSYWRRSESPLSNFNAQKAKYAGYIWRPTPIQIPLVELSASWKWQQQKRENPTVLK